jgi:hypothetical protein
MAKPLTQLAWRLARPRQGGAGAAGHGWERRRARGAEGRGQCFSLHRAGPGGGSRSLSKPGLLRPYTSPMGLAGWQECHILRS